MSNERLVKAAEAVDDLRLALEIWCERDEEAGVSLLVRGAADDAKYLASSAIQALAEIRHEVERESAAYDRSREHRIDSLLSEILVRPMAAAASIAAAGNSATSYRCDVCKAEFPVDPGDPFEAHGAYLDHMDEHDDCEDDERDKASEGTA